ncbi:amino acid transporter [Plakobranchus ocellatus]|uniref:Amino acid transporter n=1 Tax=Plakobranchus ocellatus TaxID=259542 RepID=A0AAV4BHY1_9GAST|nr:amino acid transporter [Plakobranchus ocellatus]
MASGDSVNNGRQRSRGMKMARKILMDNLLIILIIIAVFIGVGMGMGLRNVWTYEDYKEIFYLEFPGRLLLNMLKMLILPLVISSLVTGMASIGTQATGKLGAAAVTYYMTTTLFAVIIGIVLVLTIHPGSSGDREKLRREGSSTNAKPLDSLLDLVSQCFPENLVSACFERRVTDIEIVQSDPRINETDGTNYTVDLEKYGLKSDSGTNVLGIVVFSIALGIVINHLGEEGLPLKRFFSSLNSATMILINVVIWYTPFGIMFLIAGKFVATDDIGQVLSDLGKYMGTVLGGLVIHGFIVLPLMYFIATRKNPAAFAANMAKALFTAWGTASSSATLPLTMDCLVKKNKVNVNVVRFVAPVGATINMDGTALYEAVACIFIAQINGMDLSVADVIIVSLTATAAAIGAAGVPQAGLVTLVIVLTAVGLPTEDVTFILSIDWFLDRFRTTINVWGDSVGAGILNHYFRNVFKEEDEDETNDSNFQADEKNASEKFDEPMNGITNEAFDAELTKM